MEIGVIYTATAVLPSLVNCLTHPPGPVQGSGPGKPGYASDLPTRPWALPRPLPRWHLDWATLPRLPEEWKGTELLSCPLARSQDPSSLLTGSTPWVTKGPDSPVSSTIDVASAVEAWDLLFCQPGIQQGCSRSLRRTHSRPGKFSLLILKYERTTALRGRQRAQLFPQGLA